MTEPDSLKKPAVKALFVQALPAAVGLLALVFVLSLGYVFYWSFLVGPAAVERTRSPHLGLERLRKAVPVSLSLDPEAKTVNLGAPFAVQVKVDTQSKEASAADAVINFDNSVLEVREVAEGEGFDHYFKEVRDEEGKVYLSAIVDPGRAFKGRGVLGIIVFRAKALGETSVGFDSAPTGGENSSRVVGAQTGENILTITEGAIYTVIEKSN